MQKGKVKWFNATKGYGFIKVGDSDKDVFVHISAVSAAGLKTLNDDQDVEFDIEDNGDRKSAVNLKLVD